MINEEIRHELIKNAEIRLKLINMLSVSHAPELPDDPQAAAMAIAWTFVSSEEQEKAVAYAYGMVSSNDAEWLAEVTA
ncbi:hypothetical protein V4C53_30205 [Paraburkholderia azotifigens]|uniref:hypothetical protein n=1 Tax=Paraburkholderia azotifigens TaxID=2057004 RepID=UPI003181D545